MWSPWYRGIIYQTPFFMPEGENDFERAVTEGLCEILAVNVPNEKGCGKNGSWQQYVCSVNYIEEIESRVMGEAGQ